MNGATETQLQRLARAMRHDRWVGHCRTQRKTFSAVTTYLAQFMAHDMVLTAKDAMNFSAPGPMMTGTHNLRQMPLRLESLYGQGRRLNGPLFGQHGLSTDGFGIEFELKTFKLPGGYYEDRVWAPAFKLVVTQPSSDLSHSRPVDLTAVPVLGDPRNADQPMLLFIVVAFMRLHNYFIANLPDPSVAGVHDDMKATRKFEMARILTTLVWHDVIRNDILGPLCCDKSKQVGPEKLSALGPDPFQAVMRALHALPINEYHLHGPKVSPRLKTLQDLLGSDAVTFKLRTPITKQNFSMALQNWWWHWGVDYDYFIDDPFNSTNVMPTLSTGLGLQDLFAKDAQVVQTLGHAGPNLNRDLSGKISDLNHALESRTGIQGLPSAEDLPLSVAFLAEAYAENADTGGFGPYGSALFAKAVEAALTKAELDLSHPTLDLGMGELIETRPTDFKGILSIIN